MMNNSSLVVSNQTTIHDDLKQIVTKHLRTNFKKPYRDFSKQIFEELDQYQKVINKPIILDSGCGTGESSINLAALNPEHLIIGIDKSADRLKKFLGNKSVYHQKNVLIARGDVIDIWRMAKQASWKIDKHYLLYPNPWPKKDQFKKRWHGHPIFPEMLNLCKAIELRTNWQIYLEEFKQALEIITKNKASIEFIEPSSFISPFEKKYYESGHGLHKLHI